MSAQITDTVLMVRPAAFGYNPQTAASNAFQHNDTARDAGQIQRLALQEFDALAEQLIALGVRVIIGEDTLEPHKPDAVFPNNWISFHREGQIVTYPMLATQRRAERRPELYAALQQQFGHTVHHDLSHWENQGIYLEGTGSLVLDRDARIAYAALSPRTHPLALADFCEKMNYQPLAFSAKDGNGMDIYHTNVMMALGSTFAVVCLETLASTERARLEAQLEATGKTIIPISLAQMVGFAGNVLQLRNPAGARILVLSEQAHRILDQDQLIILADHNDYLLFGHIPTIELLGGGSVRCMLAEIFSPPIP